MSGARRWVRPPGDELVWRSWGEANFIYHVASGQTHFLNELGAWILRDLGPAPSSCDEVCARLTAAFAADTTPELVEAAGATLQVLAGLGLIESAA